MSITAPERVVEVGPQITLTGQVDERGAQYFVHLDGGRVGEASFGFHGHAAHSCGWALHDVAAHGNRGIMSQALPAILADLAAHGVTAGRTYIWEDNEPSIRLASRSGLVPGEARDGIRSWTWDHAGTPVPGTR